MDTIDQRAKLELIRITSTGDLNTYLYRCWDCFVAADGDGQEHHFCNGDLVLVLAPFGDDHDLIESLVDGLELGVHGGYSARTGRPPIRTVDDIRTANPRAAIQSSAFDLQ